MSELVEKQFRFTQLIARFYWELSDLGYQVTLGESYRPPETAKVYADEGKGIVHSLHSLRLAQDLNLFNQNGALLDYSVEAYSEAGKLWESYSSPGFETCWGGRFSKLDVDHFSMAHNGAK